MIIGMACNEIPAWLDIDGRRWCVREVSRSSPMGGRRRCNGNASHPSKRWSPKRFFISPNSTSPWDTWRRWRDTAAISSFLFADPRGTHFLRCDRFLSPSYSRAFRKFISHRIESAVSRSALWKPLCCNHRSIVLRSFDKITDSWRVKFRGSSDLSLLWLSCRPHRSGTFLLTYSTILADIPQSLRQCAEKLIAKTK